MQKLTLAFIAGSTMLLAAETKVQIKDLPEPVQKTIKKQASGATLKGINKEIEHGKTYYEAETVVNGKSRDVLIDPSGEVVEVEEDTTLADIPEPARLALQKQAATGKILSVESSKKGSTVSYEAVIQNNGKKSEVAVNANGSPAKD
ncbi:MAG: hypothetical protein WBW33_12795 [Bryobacteraceae bacterium]